MFGIVLELTKGSLAFATTERQDDVDDNPRVTELCSVCECNDEWCLIDMRNDNNKDPLLNILLMEVRTDKLLVIVDCTFPT